MTELEEVLAQGSNYNVFVNLHFIAMNKIIR